jgi:hypothetical protein
MISRMTAKETEYRATWPTATFAYLKENMKT